MNNIIDIFKDVKIKDLHGEEIILTNLNGNIAVSGKIFNPKQSLNKGQYIFLFYKSSKKKIGVIELNGEIIKQIKNCRNHFYYPIDQIKTIDEEHKHYNIFRNYLGK